MAYISVIRANTLVTKRRTISLLVRHFIPFSCLTELIG